MARQAIEKYAEVPPATRGTAESVRGELGRLDPVHRFVTCIAAGNFRSTFESTLPGGTSLLSMPYRSLTDDARR